MSHRLRPSVLAAALLAACTAVADDYAIPKRDAAVDAPVEDDGSVHSPGLTIPYSGLASREARENFLELARFFSVPPKGPPPADVNAGRKRLDDLIMRPGLEKLLQVFPVQIRSETIGGVRTDIVEPTGGIAKRNKRRVLINLH